jgi:predicted DsbA family dithiol-disulfide isomerase
VLNPIPATKPAPLELEIFFDLSCPFCLLAKVKLDRLLPQARVPVNITWSPLVRFPWIPPEGLDFQAAHTERYGEKSRPMQLEVERMARELGLPLDHERVKKIPNTMDAHRVIRFAAETRRDTQMIDAVLRAYLLEGRDISDRTVLAQLATKVGLDATNLQIRLASEWKRHEVMAANEYSISRGARSVPSYCLDGEYIDKTVDLIPRLDTAPQ